MASARATTSSCPGTAGLAAGRDSGSSRHVVRKYGQWGDGDDRALVVATEALEAGDRSGVSGSSARRDAAGRVCRVESSRQSATRRRSHTGKRLRLAGHFRAGAARPSHGQVLVELPCVGAIDLVLHLRCRREVFETSAFGLAN